MQRGTMPIKYTRDGAGFALGRRESKWQPPRLRQRLILIYVGLCFISLLLIGYFVAAGPNRQRVDMEAQATVVEKPSHSGSERSGAFELVLDVQLPDNKRARTTLFTDASSWAAVEIGDRVLVHYKRPFLSNAIRVHRMSMIDEAVDPESIP